MSAITECKLLELKNRLPQPIDYLFFSASFEKRAYGICEQLWKGCSKRFLCFNKNHLVYLQASVDRLKSFVENPITVSFDSDFPLEIFNAFRDAIEQIKTQGPCHVGVDITCFTREALSVLYFLLRHELPKGSVITAIYQRAVQYGRSRKGGWLTEGVREVRTVLGYSGSVSLSANTHLIIVPGFEYERAQEIVDAVQPTRISLGHAIAEKNVSPELNLDHESFLLKLEALYHGSSFDPFDFSCFDPFKTRDNVLELVKTSSNRNVVVACLNTKPAMFGVCLAALENRSIQLVYAQPISYNTKSYSEPSGEVLFFNIHVS
jgi:hypothetical protein